VEAAESELAGAQGHGPERFQDPAGPSHDPPHPGAIDGDGPCLSSLPATRANILDEDKQGVLGRPLDRVDGALKVTGPRDLYVRICGPGQGSLWLHRRRVDRQRADPQLDTAEAARLPGVLMVMTCQNAPKQGAYVTSYKVPQDKGPYGVARPFLCDDRVRYYGEPIALVVAESFEQAREAAALVGVTYEAGPTPCLPREAGGRPCL